MRGVLFKSGVQIMHIQFIETICSALMYVLLQSNIIFEGKNHQRSECNKKDYVLQELQKLSLCVVIE